MSRTNLKSRASISRDFVFEERETWFADELAAYKDAAVRRAIRSVHRDLESFVIHPERAQLLWQGCDRCPLPDKQQRRHKYPMEIRVLAKASEVRLNGLPNGPAIAAFQLAGGERPQRFGSTNDWSIHHLYSGKFPWPGNASTLHATKDGNHFTQSAGLVAVHPIADAICDEFPAFTWWLRAEAFHRFAYDPDGVFASRRSKFGFVKRRCKVVYAEQSEQRCTIERMGS